MQHENINFHVNSPGIKPSFRNILMSEIHQWMRKDWLLENIASTSQYWKIIFCFRCSCHHTDHLHHQPSQRIQTGKQKSGTKLPGQCAVHLPYQTELRGYFSKAYFHYWKGRVLITRDTHSSQALKFCLPNTAWKFTVKGKKTHKITVIFETVLYDKISQ